MKYPAVIKVEVSEKEFTKYYNKYSNLVYHVLSLYDLDNDMKEDMAMYVLCQIPRIIKKYKYHKANLSTYIGNQVHFIVKHIRTYGYQVKDKIIYTNNIDSFVTRDSITDIYKFDMKLVKRLLTEEEYDLIFTVYVMGKTILQYSKIAKISYCYAKEKHKAIIDKLKVLTEDYFK